MISVTSETVHTNSPKLPRKPGLGGLFLFRKSPGSQSIFATASFRVGFLLFALDIDPSITGVVNDESDNCAVGIIATYSNDSTNLERCDEAGYIVRTWSLDDGNGNIYDQEQIIWVEPVPIVIPVVDETILCDSSYTNILLTSSNVYTSGSVTFNYSVVATGGVTGFTSPETGLTDGYIINDQLYNPSADKQTVSYTITPVSPGGCGNGDDTTIVITVNPTPELSVTIPETIYCDSSQVSFTVTDGLTSSTGTQVYSVTRVYDENDVHIEDEVPGLDDNQAYGVALEDDIRNLTTQVQTVSYIFKALIKDPRGDGSLAECNEGVDTTIVIRINPTPELSVTIPEAIYCDSSEVTITVTDDLLGSTGATAYHLTRTYDENKIKIEGQVPGTLINQAYGSIPDEVRNLTDETQTITYRFKPVILDPRGDGLIVECNEGGDTTIVITVNPTPELSVTIPETIYCDSSQVSFTVTDGLTSSTGTQVYSVTRVYDENDVHIEDEVPGLDDNQAYGVALEDDIRNLTTQVQTVSYIFKALIKDPRGDGSLAECNEGVDTTIVITINPTPELSVTIPEAIYCDSSEVTITVTDDLLGSTGATAYHLTRTYDENKIKIEGQIPGTLINQGYGSIPDEVRNLTDETQTITYRFKPVILDPRGDGLIVECNEGGDTTIVITVNPTPRLSVTIPEAIYCDSSEVTITVTDDLLGSTGATAYHLTRTYDENKIKIEGQVPGTLINQAYGSIPDEVRNLTDETQTITYRFKPVILDPRGDGSNCRV